MNCGGHEIPHSLRCGRPVREAAPIRVCEVMVARTPRWRRPWDDHGSRADQWARGSVHDRVMADGMNTLRALENPYLNPMEFGVDPCELGSSFVLVTVVTPDYRVNPFSRAVIDGIRSRISGWAAWLFLGR